jgi:hypothetical protein
MNYEINVDWDENFEALVRAGRVVPLGFVFWDVKEDRLMISVLSGQVPSEVIAMIQGYRATTKDSQSARL